MSAFFRMAERRIAEKTGRGVACFISNFSWLDGLSFTGMRERYLEAFDAVPHPGWNRHHDLGVQTRPCPTRPGRTVFVISGGRPNTRNYWNRPRRIQARYTTASSLLSCLPAFRQSLALLGSRDEAARRKAPTTDRMCSTGVCGCARRELIPRMALR